MCQRHSRCLAGAHQGESVFSHDGHFQGNQLVLSTRTLQGDEESRGAATTFATSPVEQVAQRQPAVTFSAAGPVGMVGGQRMKPELPTYLKDSYR